MEFFIDTGMVEEIKEAASWGVIDGVTTNPSLIAQTGRKQADVIKEICEIVDGPISAEVIALDYEGMIKEAAELKEIHENVVIKLPMTSEGIKACKWCTENGVKTNVTLVFSPNQALLAAKVGATYVSPFIGRLDDIGHDGMAVIEEIRTLFDNYGYTTKVLAASIRTATHVRDCALIGSDVATIPFGVLKKLFGHTLTDKGIAGFMADHAKANAQ
jgi:transaldolase